MTKENVIKLTPKYIQAAKEVLAGLPEDQVKDVTMFIAGQFIEEIGLGLEGELEYREAPFFEVVDKMYEESQPKGCYFCDRSIDGNEKPFDYPNSTKLCLTCMLKVANLMVAFGINPGSLFPGMGDRQIQAVLYDDFQSVKRQKGEVVH